MALLWVSTAEALSFETACENAKLSAAARYHQCLTRAYKKANAHGDEPSEEAIARCDERFDRGFERAEASGACRTPGGSSSLREPLKAGVQQLVDNLMAGTGCADLTIDPGGVATCSVNKTISAIDLAAVVDQLSEFGVTDDTAFWIQAWGGNGSNGNVCCNFGGRGGTGGYAQVTTSLNALRSWYRTTELYYYLGLNGTFGGSAGGDGGTSTLVTINDLTQGGVRLVRTLLIAGGGGGGGAGRGARACAGQFRIIGSGGGAGGVVFSGSSPFSVVVRDQDGEVFVGQITVDNSGKGGTGGGGGAGNGGGSEPGGDPTAPLGGRGGNHDTLQIGFANASGTEVTGAAAAVVMEATRPEAVVAVAATPAVAAVTEASAAPSASPAAAVADRAMWNPHRIRRDAPQRPPRGRPTRTASRASSRSPSISEPASSRGMAQNWRS